MARLICAVLAVSGATALGRTRALLDANWKFQGGSAPAPQCKDPNGTFPIPLDGQQCMGLSQASATDLDSCINACCADDTCATYQWCESAPCTPVGSCWIGAMAGCQADAGWISRGRNVAPPPPPPAGSQCTDPRCQPGTDDSGWRGLDLPHDFVVEGDFSPNADKSHGYLPFGVGWYRKHFVAPAALSASPSLWVEFDGIQTASTVWLNGFLLGEHASGYTPSRYFLNTSQVNFGADNVLAVKADATNPDGWWYDGGGIYRHVWLTGVPTPGPFIAPHGVYAPSAVTGAITWAAGAPFADAQLTPSVEIWSNASAPASQAFAVTLTVYDAAGTVVATASGAGAVPANGQVTWSPAAPLALPHAALWHLVAPPLAPALYKLAAAVTVGGVAVDGVNVTFGVRTATFDNATGFWLNGVNTKIMGTANHQDFAGVGVAIPDHLQWYRVAKLKQMGVNGWRTAHNPPNPALLDAADALGMVVWDENHRNGQDAECELLIRRDRNHPSVVIWSLCNEVLCNTDNWVPDALRLKALIRTLDPLGGRPVSANQNGWIGPNTPLDLQGFDYSTGNYDQWHNEAPGIPSISSETSSAVSDRGEYANNEATGHVQGYDNQYPGWGESAEQAWGGVGMGNGQGILTRPFISGGWTWTGWDYRGEPTPYGWPDVNSHFGIIDLAGFEKDRFYWYQAWFVAPTPPVVYLFPHWNWDPAVNATVDVWSYSNADEVELFVNGVSAGRKAMQRYSHTQWLAVPVVAGSLRAVAYVAGAAVAETWRNTTGAPAALVATIRDGVGAQLYAGCVDAALVQVAVVDAAGAVVPTAGNNVTFTVSGPGAWAGASNGDPACLVNNKATTRPAYHGLVLGVVAGGAATGTITVAVSSPGLAPASVQIPVVAQDASVSEAWCHTGPAL